MPIRYAIIEDNPFALEHLKLSVKRLRPEWELVFTSGSVTDTVAFLQNNPDLDIIFMDIELSDGKCFVIFDKVRTVIPIIFTTAYNEHAIQAFKVNGVDYILKPVSDGELSHAIDKFEYLRSQRASAEVKAETDKPEITASRADGPQRILTVSGDNFSYINLSEIALFVSEDNYVFAIKTDGTRKMINMTNLSKLEETLSPNDFFRISRNVIAHISSIKSVHKYFRGRLKVCLKAGGYELDIHVSSGRRDAFLEWLGR